MRTQLLLGKVNMVFPDEVVFTNDRNTITLTYVAAGNETVGGVFTFTNQQGKTATIMYSSEKQFLVFNLLSTLKKLMNNNTFDIVTVSGSVLCDDVAEDIAPFTLKCVNGRTLHSRNHNSERIVYYYDQQDLVDFYVLMLNPGTINGVPVQSGVVKRNLSYLQGDFNVTIIDGNVERVVNVKKSALGGDNGYDTGCDDEGGSGTDSNNGGVLRVRYYNTDGCLRHLVGKITNRKRTVGYTNWRADDIVRHTPNGMITTTTDEITVGFPAIKRESYAEDIMFSPIIEYLNLNGEWQPCIISSKNVQLPNWDENDIEITFTTLS